MTGSRAESASESRISRIVPVFISGVWLASDVPVTSDVSDDSVSVSVSADLTDSDVASAALSDSASDVASAALFDSASDVASATLSDSASDVSCYIVNSPKLRVFLLFCAEFLSFFFFSIFSQKFNTVFVHYLHASI